MTGPDMESVDERRDAINTRYEEYISSYSHHLPMNLQAQDVSYIVAEGMANMWWARLTSLQMPWEWTRGPKRKKRVLNGVSFQVNCGQMLAILGSSGSGKTSLLDVLACRQTSGVLTGRITVNGVERTETMIKRHAGYVRQDDRLLPNLTVRESLMFVAHLKLPTSFNKEQIETRVDSVVAELGLRPVYDSKVGGAEIRGISGGERKRVSIATQLLVDPSILLLDEPTSGLDSFTAHHLVETLSTLAKNNRTILLTIHQPRSDIFKLFDLVMILTEGNVAYYGEAAKMIPYFTKLQYPCPEFTNPCDFYVDLCTVDTKTEVTEIESSRRVDSLVKQYSQEMLQNDSGAFVNGAEDEPTRLRRDLEATRLYLPGWFTQWAVLTRRALINNFADYGFLLVQIAESVFMSLVIGVVYLNLQFDQYAMRDRFALMFILGALYPYMMVVDVVGKYHKERWPLYHDLQDGLYTPGPFFWAKLVSEIPEHTLFLILYSVPYYWLSNMQNDALLFFQTFVILFLTAYCCRCVGMAFAAVFPTCQSATTSAQGFFATMLLSGGFIINMDNLFEGMKWLSNVSFLKWSYQSLCLVELPGLNFTCPLPIGTCIHNGSEALKYYSMENIEMWKSCTILGAESIFFLIVFYIALTFISQKPQES